MCLLLWSLTNYQHLFLCWADSEQTARNSSFVWKEKKLSRREKIISKEIKLHVNSFVDPYHIETSPLICSAYQLTDFLYDMGLIEAVLVMSGYFDSLHTNTIFSQCKNVPNLYHDYPPSFNCCMQQMLWKGRNP